MGKRIESLLQALNNASGSTTYIAMKKHPQSDPLRVGLPNTGDPVFIARRVNGQRYEEWSGHLDALSASDETVYIAKVSITYGGQFAGRPKPPIRIITTEISITIGSDTYPLPNLSTYTITVSDD